MLCFLSDDLFDKLFSKACLKRRFFLIMESATQIAKLK
ncbi:hypothetical protein ANH9381_1522 [Aggregatibacter actinomycetemcomitans ANH9381]|nr:hypothetical protein ANH9381_1522 [Aggregatibacter actinomycetemcomitans ANH9381]